MGLKALGAKGCRAVITAAAGLVALLAGPVATAAAVERVIAGPQPSTYLNPEVEIDVGEELRFLNTDTTAPHDVTSIEVGPNGEALFRSETVNAITDVPVSGAESLPPGSYEFICSIHSFMEGTLAVGGEGEGGGGGDTKAPVLKLRAPDQDVEDVLEAGKLKLRAKVNESATLRVRARQKGDAATIAKARAKLDKGGNRVAAKLTSKGKRMLSNADRVMLKLSARVVDAAGNARKVSETVVLN